MAESGHLGSDPLPDESGQAADAELGIAFGYAFLPTYTALSCGGTLFGFLLIFLKDGWEMFGNWEAAVVSLLVVLVSSAVLTAVMIVRYPVIVFGSCLNSTNWWGEYERVGWNEIQSIKWLNVVGLRFLLVNGNVFIPLFLADQKGFLEAVKTAVGDKDHPLVLALERHPR